MTHDDNNLPEIHGIALAVALGLAAWTGILWAVLWLVAAFA